MSALELVCTSLYLYVCVNIMDELDLVWKKYYRSGYLFVRMVIEWFLELRKLREKLKNLIPVTKEGKEKQKLKEENAKKDMKKKKHEGSQENNSSANEDNKHSSEIENEEDININ